MESFISYYPGARFAVEADYTQSIPFGYVEHLFHAERLRASSLRAQSYGEIYACH